MDSYHHCLKIPSCNKAIMVRMMLVERMVTKNGCCFFLCRPGWYCWRYKKKMDHDHEEINKHSLKEVLVFILILTKYFEVVFYIEVNKGGASLGETTRTVLQEETH